MRSDMFALDNKMICMIRMCETTQSYIDIPYMKLENDGMA